MKTSLPRLYMPSDAFKEFVALHEKGREGTFNFRENLSANGLDWRAETMVFLSAKEHQRILWFVKRDAVDQCTQSLKNLFLKSNGLELDLRRECEVDFQGIIKP